MSSRAINRSGKFLGFGFLVLIVGLTLSWLGGFGYLPLQPQLVIGVTVVLFLLILCLSSTTIMASTSFIARQKTSFIPESPKDGMLSRVVRDSVTGSETIIQANENSSMREVLEDDWPFRMKESDDWYLVDASGNDVTNWPISNWDGIAVIHFR